MHMHHPNNIPSVTSSCVILAWSEKKRQTLADSCRLANAKAAVTSVCGNDRTKMT
jgi:hypothetical protein